MPRQIDPQLRRQEIAALAAGLIADHGIERLSFRALASAAGASTTVITHYFANKQELMVSAYHSAVEQARRRVESLPAISDPRHLQLACEAVLPVDAESLRNWRVWLAFFGVAVFDDALTELQKQRVTAHRRLLQKSITAGQLAGQVDPLRQPAVEARTLMALVQGIATEATFDTSDWPAERQKRCVRRHLRSLVGPVSGRAGD